MDELKQNYNAVLARITAGEKYIDANTNLTDMDKLITGYKLLVSHGNKLLKQIRDAGVEVTSKDVLEGFTDGKTSGD